MNIDFQLILSIAFFGISLIVFAVLGRQPTIYTRRKLPIVFVISNLTFIAVIVLFLKYIGISFSDTVAILGLVLTFLIGFGGNAFLQRHQEILVVFAITSSERFVEEVKRGFYNNIGGLPIKTEDLYLDQKNKQMNEDLANFMPIMQKGISQKPDYLIILPPSDEKANSPELKQELLQFTKNGGRVIIIQNPPADIAEYKGRVTCISSDVKTGATLLAKLAIKIHSPSETVYLLNGPQYSPPAAARQNQLEAVLKSAGIPYVSDAKQHSWTENEAYTEIRQYLQSNSNSPPLGIIICGNDTMAFGATRAIEEFTKIKPTSTKIFGYDGLTLALVLIAMENSPFYATIRIPPSTYGDIAANMIKGEVTGKAQPSTQNMNKLITIDETHLVTQGNTAGILELL
jgi:ABC-type sugar transport system substrate-binding protein